MTFRESKAFLLCWFMVHVSMLRRLGLVYIRLAWVWLLDLDGMQQLTVAFSGMHCIAAMCLGA
jgi:hypothetical protein